jgi:hypothetical protein
MHSAGARALREDDNQMSREAVLLQWERKIEVAERLDAGERVEADQRVQPTGGRFARAEEASPSDEAALTPPVALRPVADEPQSKPRRFERAARQSAVEGGPAAKGQPAAERRTITITGQPTPARRRRAVVEAQLAQPDRIALWAFLLGLLLVAVAAGTAHA